MSGDIECFKGSHLALALLAIMILTISALLIPTMAGLSIVKVNNNTIYINTYCIGVYTSPTCID